MRKYFRNCLKTLLSVIASDPELVEGKRGNPVLIHLMAGLLRRLTPRNDVFGQFLTLFLSAFILAAISAPMVLDAKSPETTMQLSAWQFQSVITGSAMATPDFVLMELPSDFFSHLKPDLRDLRIGTAGDNTVVPYALATDEAEARVERVTARMFNMTSAPGKDTSFFLDLASAGAFHNAVTIETLSENFRRIVRIDGANDTENWRTLNPKGQIFDYTVRDINPVKVRDTTVRYPDATFRYLRVTIVDAGENPLAVRGATVVREVRRLAREITYTPSRMRSEDADKQRTDLILDLNAAGIPHRRGQIETASYNFNRAIAISASDDAQTWRLLGHGVIYAISTPRFSGSRLTFEYPESHTRYMKISIFNRDDQPLAIADVALFGLVRNIVFRAVPKTQYIAYLGNPSAPRPQYDIEYVAQYMETATLNRVAAGPVEKNPGYIAPILPKKPLTERAPSLLSIVLGVIVVPLGFFLFRMMRQVKRVP